ncbi:unnamed protein product [Amoebophrya sp. A120]|nr:unnamed protein product [Amoebophrya sp. A120]|eukprot:GSA120T00001701001.1
MGDGSMNSGRESPRAAGLPVLTTGCSWSTRRCDDSSTTRGTSSASSSSSSSSSAARSSSEPNHHARGRKQHRAAIGKSNHQSGIAGSGITARSSRHSRPRRSSHSHVTDLERAKLKAFFEQRFGSVSQAFEKMDVLQDGQLSCAEFQEILAFQERYCGLVEARRLWNAFVDRGAGASRGITKDALLNGLCHLEQTIHDVDPGASVETEDPEGANLLDVSGTHDLLHSSHDQSFYSNISISPASSCASSRADQSQMEESFAAARVSSPLNGNSAPSASGFPSRPGHQGRFSGANCSPLSRDSRASLPPTPHTSPPAIDEAAGVSQSALSSPVSSSARRRPAELPRSGGSGIFDAFDRRQPVGRPSSFASSNADNEIDHSRLPFADVEVVSCDDKDKAGDEINDQTQHTRGLEERSSYLRPSGEQKAIRKPVLARSRQSSPVTPASASPFGSAPPRFGRTRISASSPKLETGVTPATTSTNRTGVRGDAAGGFPSGASASLFRNSVGTTTGPQEDHCELVSSDAHSARYQNQLDGSEGNSTTFATSGGKNEFDSTASTREQEVADFCRDVTYCLEEVDCSMVETDMTFGPDLQVSPQIRLELSPAAEGEEDVRGSDLRPYPARNCTTIVENRREDASVFPTNSSTFLPSLTEGGTSGDEHVTPRQDSCAESARAREENLTSSPLWMPHDGSSVVTPIKKDEEQGHGTSTVAVSAAATFSSAAGKNATEPSTLQVALERIQQIKQRAAAAGLTSSSRGSSCTREDSATRTPPLLPRSSLGEDQADHQIRSRSGNKRGSQVGSGSARVSLNSKKSPLAGRTPMSTTSSLAYSGSSPPTSSHHGSVPGSTEKEPAVVQRSPTFGIGAGLVEENAGAVTTPEHPRLEPRCAGAAVVTTPEHPRLEPRCAGDLDVSASECAPDEEDITPLHNEMQDQDYSELDFAKVADDRDPTPTSEAAAGSATSEKVKHRDVEDRFKVFIGQGAASTCGVCPVTQSSLTAESDGAATSSEGTDQGVSVTREEISAAAVEQLSTSAQSDTRLASSRVPESAFALAGRVGSRRESCRNSLEQSTSFQYLYHDAEGAPKDSFVFAEEGNKLLSPMSPFLDRVYGGTETDGEEEQEEASCLHPCRLSGLSETAHHISLSGITPPPGVVSRTASGLDPPLQPKSSSKGRNHAGVFDNSDLSPTVCSSENNNESARSRSPRFRMNSHEDDEQLDHSLLRLSSDAEDGIQLGVQLRSFPGSQVQSDSGLGKKVSGENATVVPRFQRPFVSQEEGGRWGISGQGTDQLTCGTRNRATSEGALGSFDGEGSSSPQPDGAAASPSQPCPGHEEPEPASSAYPLHKIEEEDEVVSSSSAQLTPASVFRGQVDDDALRSSSSRPRDAQQYGDQERAQSQTSPEGQAQRTDDQKTRDDADALSAATISCRRNNHVTLMSNSVSSWHQNLSPSPDEINEARLVSTRKTADSPASPEDAARTPDGFRFDDVAHKYTASSYSSGRVPLLGPLVVDADTSKDAGNKRSPVPRLHLPSPDLHGAKVVGKRSQVQVEDDISRATALSSSSSAGRRTPPHEHHFQTEKVAESCLDDRIEAIVNRRLREERAAAAALSAQVSSHVVAQPLTPSSPASLRENLQLRTAPTKGRAEAAFALTDSPGTSPDTIIAASSGGHGKSSCIKQHQHDDVDDGTSARTFFSPRPQHAHEPLAKLEDGVEKRETRRDFEEDTRSAESPRPGRLQRPVICDPLSGSSVSSTTQCRSALKGDATSSSTTRTACSAVASPVDASTPALRSSIVFRCSSSSSRILSPIQTRGALSDRPIVRRKSVNSDSGSNEKKSTIEASVSPAENEKSTPVTALCHLTEITSASRTSKSASSSGGKSSAGKKGIEDSAHRHADLHSDSATGDRHCSDITPPTRNRQHAKLGVIDSEGTTTAMRGHADQHQHQERLRYFTPPGKSNAADENTLRPALHDADTLQSSISRTSLLASVVDNATASLRIGETLVDLQPGAPVCSSPSSSSLVSSAASTSRRVVCGNSIVSNSSCSAVSLYSASASTRASTTRSHASSSICTSTGGTETTGRATARLTDQQVVEPDLLQLQTARGRNCSTPVKPAQGKEKETGSANVQLASQLATEEAFLSNLRETTIGRVTRCLEPTRSQDGDRLIVLDDNAFGLGSPSTSLRPEEDPERPKRSSPGALPSCRSFFDTAGSAKDTRRWTAVTEADERTPCATRLVEAAPVASTPVRLPQSSESELLRTSQELQDRASRTPRRQIVLRATAPERVTYQPGTQDHDPLTLEDVPDDQLQAAEHSRSPRKPTTTAGRPMEASSCSKPRIVSGGFYLSSSVRRFLESTSVDDENAASTSTRAAAACSQQGRRHCRSAASSCSFDATSDTAAAEATDHCMDTREDTPQQDRCRRLAEHKARNNRDTDIIRSCPSSECGDEEAAVLESNHFDSSSTVAARTPRRSCDVGTDAFVFESPPRRKGDAINSSSSRQQSVARRLPQWSTTAGPRADGNSTFAASCGFDTSPSQRHISPSGQIRLSDQKRSNTPVLVRLDFDNLESSSPAAGRRGGRLEPLEELIPLPSTGRRRASGQRTSALAMLEAEESSYIGEPDASLALEAGPESERDLALNPFGLDEDTSSSEPEEHGRLVLQDDGNVAPSSTQPKSSRNGNQARARSRPDCYNAMVRRDPDPHPTVNAPSPSQRSDFELQESSTSKITSVTDLRSHHHAALQAENADEQFHVVEPLSTIWKKDPRVLGCLLRRIRRRLNGRSVSSLLLDSRTQPAGQEDLHLSRGEWLSLFKQHALGINKDEAEFIFSELEEKSQASHRARPPSVRQEDVAPEHVVTGRKTNYRGEQTAVVSLSVFEIALAHCGRALASVINLENWGRSVVQMARAEATLGGREFVETLALVPAVDVEKFRAELNLTADGTWALFQTLVDKTYSNRVLSQQFFEWCACYPTAGAGASPSEPEARAEGNQFQAPPVSTPHSSSPGEMKSNGLLPIGAENQSTRVMTVTEEEQEGSVSVSASGNRNRPSVVRRVVRRPRRVNVGFPGADDPKDADADLTRCDTIGSRRSKSCGPVIPILNTRHPVYATACAPSGQEDLHRSELRQHGSRTSGTLRRRRSMQSSPRRSPASGTTPRMKVEKMPFGSARSNQNEDTSTTTQADTTSASVSPAGVLSAPRAGRSNVVIRRSRSEGPRVRRVSRTGRFSVEKQEGLEGVSVVPTFSGSVHGSHVGLVLVADGANNDDPYANLLPASEEEALSFQTELASHARGIMDEARRAQARVAVLRQQLEDQEARHEDELSKLRQMHKQRMQDMVQCFLADYGLSMEQSV